MLNTFVGCSFLKEKLLKTKMTSGSTREARQDSSLALLLVSVCLNRSFGWFSLAQQTSACCSYGPWKNLHLLLQSSGSRRHVGIWWRGDSRAFRVPSRAAACREPP